MIRQVKTTLRCSWCLSEAPTLITYMGDSIVKMECQSCGHIYRISKASLYSSILSQWERRVLTKPLRLAKEIKSHPSRFVLSFPFRVLTKPLRVTKELAQTYIKS